MRMSDWSSDVCSSDLIGGIAGADHESVIIIEADAIGGIADVETEQMVVLEEHAGLDREVQGLEAVGDGKFDTAPDGGLHVFERDANPCDLVGHAAMLTGALCAVQFHGMSSSQREAGQQIGRTSGRERGVQ